MMWLFAALAEPVVLFLWHRWLGATEGVALGWLQVSYGLGFALFSGIFLGTLARWRVTAYPAFWRMATVLAGGAAAAAEIGLHGYPRSAFLPLWAAALIGITTVTLLARLLPAGLRALWLAGEGQR